jgi:hypothetical protein
MTAPRHPFNFNRLQHQALILLCIALIGGGLILTGVVRVRQSAAQMQCRNNLKQLSLGVSNYQHAMGQLPPLVDQGEGSPTGRGLPSLHWTLIPYLESTWRLYDPHREGRTSVERYHAHSSTSFTLQGKMSETLTQHGGDVNHPWRTFTCPADTTADKLRDVHVTLPDGSTGYYATGSYVANGMLPWNKKGGTLNSANTILFAERPQVCRTASGDTVHTLWGVGFYGSQMPAFATLTPTDPPGLWCTGQVAAVLPLPDADGEVLVRIGRANAEPQAPDFAHPIQQVRHNRPCDPRLPGAMHPDGMSVAMADGSTRVFRYDVSPRVFWAACVPPR